MTTDDEEIQPVILEFHPKEAENLRQTVMALLDGRKPMGNYKMLLDKLAGAGVQQPTTAQCPEFEWVPGKADQVMCEHRFLSEAALYTHLIDVHRYPGEDAGSAASEAWRTR